VSYVITYKPLWELLRQKNIKRSELREILGFSPNTIAKMSKNQFVSLQVIEKICREFDCDVSDVISFDRRSKDE